MLTPSVRIGLQHAGKRAYHDLNILPRKAIVSQGPPGYSAVSGSVATVFGSTGFLGRYLVAKLAKMGTQVIIAYRDEDEKRRLKLTGDLGQVVPMEFDLRSETQIAECVRHSDIVFNLVGRNHETKNFTYSDVHGDGAERLARISADCGVSRFVHVSHLNAAADSPSSFYQSKAEGEQRVLNVFKEATIVRPASMYGYEDRLLTNMALYPIWWKLNYAETKIRPVHVLDIAQALANLAQLQPLARTLTLPGPSTLTYQYLLDLIASMTYEPSSTAPTVPKPIALAIAKAAQLVWWPVINPDEVLRRHMDDAETQGDWEVIGVNPSEIEHHAITYLRRFRNGANYGRPVVLPGRPTVEVS